MVPVAALAQPSGGLQRFEREQNIRRQINEQNRQLLRDSETPQPAAPEQPGTIPFTTPTPPTTAPEPRSYRFERIEFSGVSVPWAGELQALAAPYLNTSLSLSQLEELRARIRDEYRRRNLLAVVTLPPQDTASGILRVQVLEARLGEVIISQDPPHRLRDRLARNAITAAVAPGSLLRLDKLTSALLKLNDLPAVTVSSTLRPGASEGLTDVVLRISEGKTVAVELSVSNEINSFFGSVDVDAVVNSRNLFGGGELLSIEGAWWGNAQDTGTVLGTLNFQMPVSPDGAQVSLYLNRSDYRLLRELYTDDFNGYTANARMGIQHPFWRRPTRSLWGGVSGEVNRYVDDIEDVNLRDRTSQVARFTAIGQLQDSFLGVGLNTAILQYSIGNLDRSANSFDFDLDAFTANTNGVFNKLLLILNRQQIFSSRWESRLFIQAQKGFNNLDGAEQISLGYPNGVRAYPPGEAPGDSGVTGQFDLIYRLLPNLALVGFFDAGFVERLTDRYDGALSPNTYGLAGGGVGFDLGTSGEWLASLRAAWPVGSNPGSFDGTDADGVDAGVRVWASLKLWF